MPSALAVLFDIDGTLADSQRGSKPSRAWSWLINQLATGAESVYSCAEVVEVKLGIQHPLVPGVEEAIKVLKAQDVTLGMVTDRMGLLALHFLRSSPLNERDFSLIHTREGPFDHGLEFSIKHFTHQGLKDRYTLNPILDWLRQNHGISRDRVFMVGDHPRDFHAADAARVKFLASTWGYLSREQFEALGVPHSQILRSPEDLLRVVED